MNSLATTIFNGGFESISTMLPIMRVTIDPCANAYAKSEDKHRIYANVLQKRLTQQEEKL